MTISKDFEERIRLLSEEKAILDAQSRRVSAERRGRAAGLAEGRKEGEQKIKLEVVEMLKSGKPPEEIIKMYEY